MIVSFLGDSRVLKKLILTVFVSLIIPLAEGHSFSVPYSVIFGDMLILYMFQSFYNKMFL